MRPEIHHYLLSLGCFIAIIAIFSGIQYSLEILSLPGFTPPTYTNRTSKDPTDTNTKEQRPLPCHSCTPEATMADTVAANRAHFE
jgi:hypothetical protein